MISKDELLENFENFEELSSQMKIDILSEIVTPKMKDIGLNNWNGKYFWYSDFNEIGIKKVVEYRVTKGFSDFFRFGNCFYFIPTHNTKKLKNHKTPKSTHIQYAFHTQGYKDYDRKLITTNVDAINTMNEKVYLKSLGEFLDKNIKLINDWFLSNQTIEDNIKTLKSQISDPDNSGPLLITPEFILSFLYKRINENKLSQKWIEKYIEKREYLSADLIQNIYKKLN